MSKQAYIDKRLGAAALELVEACNAIVEDYQAQGLRLTLRQLYYQLVSANALPNVERSYKRLSSVVSDARLAGLMDWDAIEDRTRQPRMAAEFEGLEELAEAALRSYRLPRWEGQREYVELWVEKDALSGVLWPIAHKYHVVLMVNRGYSSQSTMYEAAQRIDEALRIKPLNCRARILYLGDHDPSGEDMVRDIRDRLYVFGIPAQVDKIALTMEQVEEHDPPPNPAKLTDPRAASYVERHGDSSWEVDALPPAVLVRLIEQAIEAAVDMDTMSKIIRQEKRDKARLRAAVRGLT